MLERYRKGREREWMRKGFEEVKMREEREIHISKIALSMIAKERIVPYISGEILNRGKFVNYDSDRSRGKERRLRGSVSQEKSRVRIGFRFKLKIEKIYKRVQLRDGFDRLKYSENNNREDVGEGNTGFNKKVLAKSKSKDKIKGEYKFSSLKEIKKV